MVFVAIRGRWLRLIAGWLRECSGACVVASAVFEAAGFAGGGWAKFDWRHGFAINDGRQEGRKAGGLKLPPLRGMAEVIGFFLRRNLVLLRRRIFAMVAGPPSEQHVAIFLA